MHRPLIALPIFVATLLGASVISGAALGATPIGAEFQVNTYTTKAQGSASVALDADGDFVVVWNSLGSAGSDTSNFSVQCQRPTWGGIGPLQANLTGCLLADIAEKPASSSYSPTFQA